MFSAPKLLAVAIILLSTAFASPVLEARATTTSCNPATTRTAVFDKLTTATAIPAGYIGSNFNGFTVEESYNQYGLNAKSKYNVAVANAEGSNIEISTGVVMQLVSFYFACVAQPPGGSFYYPVACGLQVISQSNTPLYGLQLKGTYNYTFDTDKFQQGYAANMTKVTLNLIGSNFYFNLVSGASNTMLALDSVVLIQQNPACG